MVLTYIGVSFSIITFVFDLFVYSNVGNSCDAYNEYVIVEAKKMTEVFSVNPLASYCLGQSSCADVDLVAFCVHVYCCRAVGVKKSCTETCSVNGVVMKSVGLAVVSVIKNGVIFGEQLFPKCTS